MKPLIVFLFSLFAVIFLIILFSPKKARGIRWVKVWQARDLGEVAFVKSLLEGEGIPYSTSGERAQNLFGVGSVGLGYNILTGPVQFEVPEIYESSARELLKDL